MKRAKLLKVSLITVICFLIYSFFFIRSPKVSRHHQLFCEYDPNLGWRKKSNFKGIHQTEEYYNIEEINSHSLRSPEIPYEKPSGVFRVLLLGDSFIEGYSVSKDELVSTVLQRELNVSLPNKKIEVINAGTGGYSTDQELLYYELEGKKYSPDLTVLFIYQNDILYNAQHAYRGTQKPVFTNKNGILKLTNVPVPKNKLLTRFDDLKTKFEAMFDTEVLPIEFSVWKKNPPSIIQDALKITDALILKMKNEIEGNHGKFLLFYIPHPVEIDVLEWDLFKRVFKVNHEELDRRKLEIHLSEFCQRIHLVFINPISAFKLRAEHLKLKNESLYFKFDGHWNRNGNELTAEILKDSIKEIILNKYLHLK